MAVFTWTNLQISPDNGRPEIAPTATDCRNGDSNYEHEKKATIQPPLSYHGT
jgi:hypothetical protein